MSSPKQKQSPTSISLEAFECEYCSQQFAKFSAAEEHEEICEYNNPMVASVDELDRILGLDTDLHAAVAALQDQVGGGGEWAVVQAPERRERRDSDERCARCTHKPRTFNRNPPFCSLETQLNISS